MNRDDLLRKIEAAFEDILWSDPNMPEPPVAPMNAQDLVCHLLRYNDATQRYYLPKLLVFALTEFEQSRQLFLIRRLVEFLDADFLEIDPDDPSEKMLKDLRKLTFAALNEAQASAVMHWLMFVRLHVDCDRFAAEIESAIRYWRKKATGVKATGAGS